MHATAPDPRFPRVYVDFNSACGCPGVDGICYYAYSTEDLEKVKPTDGMIVCAYQESDEFSAVGCLAHLELHDGRWLFREIQDSWFEVTNELLYVV